MVAGVEHLGGKQQWTTPRFSAIKTDHHHPPVVVLHRRTRRERDTREERETWEEREKSR
ncbi:hypothetical protein Hanom_Chr13g01211201 [Helianthus anomalus]